MMTFPIHTHFPLRILTESWLDLGTDIRAELADATVAMAPHTAEQEGQEGITENEHRPYPSIGTLNPGEQQRTSSDNREGYELEVHLKALEDFCTQGGIF